MPLREERAEFISQGLKLEGRWLAPRSAPGPAAVICHPHPQFGGNLDNNVVAAVAEALAGAGWGALRFNFRGVGLSQGQYDSMVGEIADVKAALAFLQARPEVAPGKVCLVGYSFGGLMALYAAAESQDLSALALVSPMVPAQGFARDPRLQPLHGSALPVLACTGDQDAYCPPQALADLQKLLPCRTRIFPDADHFWWGQDKAVARAVAEFLFRGSEL
jgi:hypothetical protein